MAIVAKSNTKEIIIMSRYFLIEIEEESSESFCDIRELNKNRKTAFDLYEKNEDQYGNKSSRLIKRLSNLRDAKELLRSARLTEGIIIEI